VPLASVNNKRNGLDPGNSAVPVGFAAERTPRLLPRQQARMLDGNCLNGQQHRLEVARSSTAAPLPSKAVVVFDPQRESTEAVVRCEDAYAQECWLLGQVGPLVSARQVRLEDRNFCTEAPVDAREQRTLEII
jgi:hypothetical protein